MVNLYTSSIGLSVIDLVESGELSDPVIVVLTNHAYKYQNIDIEGAEVIILQCDFADQSEIQKLLEPFLKDIKAVVCRGDKHIQYLRKITPLLPKSLLAPKEESLQASTNKQLMRREFTSKYPEISPAYLKVIDASEQSIKDIEALMNYPVIVKPASLVSSLLIQSCENQNELRSALKSVFDLIADIYEREQREEPPEVIVEQFLIGDFYSVDAYRHDDGSYFFCPPVGYLPAKSMGIDDFYLYKRWLPTLLSEGDKNEMNEVCKKSMDAVGLTHSVAHIELIKTQDGWKVIELGPRMGRFRQKMYQLGYGINHSTNDIRIRLGNDPVLPTELKEYCAAYSIYPEKEGVLEEIVGLSELETMPEVGYLKVLATKGDDCRFAKHGGKALFEVIFGSSNKERYEEICSFIEEKTGAVILD